MRPDVMPVDGSSTGTRVPKKWALLLHLPQEGIALNKRYREDGAIIYRHACALGCEGIVSKRLGSPYRGGRSPHWLKINNPAAPAVNREAEENWNRPTPAPQG
jgi:ATP-dependent DNA ligase